MPPIGIYGHDPIVIIEIVVKKRKNMKDDSPILGTGYSTWLLAGIVVFALGLRLGVMVVTESYVFKSEWDYGFEYGGMAKWVAMGEGFSSPTSTTPVPSAMMPPVYVYILALVFSLFGIFSVSSAVVIECFQSVIAASTCVAFYHLGKRLFNERAGLLAAFALAVYPPAIFFSTMRIGPILLLVFLNALIMIYLIDIHCYQRMWDTVICGLLLGLTALVQPTVLPFYPLVCGWLFGLSRFPRITTLRHIVVLTLLTLACIVPWTIRNYVVFNKFVLIKSPLGQNLLAGNNPSSNGVYQNTKGIFSEDEMHQMRPMDEVERDKLMMAKATAYIQADLKRFAVLTLRRIYAFWASVNPYRRSAYDGVRGVVYGLVVTLAVVGGVLARRQWRMLSLIAAFFLAYPISYYMTHVSFYRYRYPVEPFLILFAAYAIAEGASRWQQRRQTVEQEVLELYSGRWCSSL